MKTLLTGLLVIVAIGWTLFQGWRDHQIPGRDGSVSTIEEGQFADWFSPVETAGAGLDLLENCQLITGRNSDGDSFHVSHSKGENEFRLYFVDTPESEFKEYGGGENNGKRIDEQGAYFGGLDREMTTRVGKEAKAFVLMLLRKESFKVLTKWEDVVRPGREYCFVIVKWEGREIYLHELLVAQGLVRIHTWGADLPGGRGWRDQRSYLRKWEKAVKAARVGGWGL